MTADATYRVGEEGPGFAALRILAGALAWGAMMAVCALVSLVLDQQRGLSYHVALIVAYYLAGGFLAYVAAWPFVSWAVSRFSAPQRFGFTAILLTGFTLAATASVLALDYRIYYSEWHAAIFSRTWFYQQVFTALGSTYQYLVIGSRLYWPLAPVFLLATSWWLSRKAS